MMKRATVMVGMFLVAGLSLGGYDQMSLKSFQALEKRVLRLEGRVSFLERLPTACDEAFRIRTMQGALRHSKAAPKDQTRSEELGPRKDLRDTHREFAEFTQQPEIIQLAKLRDWAEARTALWVQRAAQRYDLPWKAVAEGALGYESAFEPRDVGGQKGYEELEDIIFKTMRVYGVSGGTLVKLALAAKTAGVARTPQEYGDFLAKVGFYAENSGLGLPNTQPARPHPKVVRPVPPPGPRGRARAKPHPRAVRPSP